MFDFLEEGDSLKLMHNMEQLSTGIENIVLDFIKEEGISGETQIFILVDKWSKLNEVYSKKGDFENAMVYGLAASRLLEVVNSLLNKNEEDMPEDFDS